MENGAMQMVFVVRLSAEERSAVYYTNMPTNGFPKIPPGLSGDSFGCLLHCQQTVFRKSRPARPAARSVVYYTANKTICQNPARLVRRLVPRLMP
jgi:hypothetical protein